MDTEVYYVVDSLNHHYPLEYNSDGDGYGVDSSMTNTP